MSSVPWCGQGLWVSPEGPLRVRAGHEPLTTLPWGLVKAVGREKRGTGREKGEGDGRRGEVEKELPPSCLGHLYISI